MKKLTFIDVEYANSKNRPICQIGLICIDYDTGKEIFPPVDLLINPEDRFQAMCVKKHKITEEKVKNCPNFNDIYPDIKKYFDDAIIVGHNVCSSDLTALYKSASKYNIKLPELYYICTLRLSQNYLCSESYKLKDLCDALNIDTGCSHNAFDDTKACYELFNYLYHNYNFDIDEEASLYYGCSCEPSGRYIAYNSLLKDLCRFCGSLIALKTDLNITDDEVSYIIDWCKEHKEYSDEKQFVQIIEFVASSYEAGTLQDVDTINQIIDYCKFYFENNGDSEETISSRILNGMLEGIASDNEINENEINCLESWLLQNHNLISKYPFCEVNKLIENIRSGQLIEHDEIVNKIKNILDPIANNKVELSSIDGLHICLSGSFTFGAKSDVEIYITERGAVRDKSVTQKTNILIIGDSECAAFSNKNYGTKAKRAFELKNKGFDIKIITESEFFKQIQ